MIASATSARPVRRGHRVPDYLPGPDEIARMCAEIRRGWSPRETDSRAGLVRVRWEIPSVRLHCETPGGDD